MFGDMLRSTANINAIDQPYTTFNNGTFNSNTKNFMF